MCSKHLRSVFDFPENIGGGGEKERERESQSYKKLVQILVKLFGQYSVGQANSWVFQ